MNTSTQVYIKFRTFRNTIFLGWILCTFSIQLGFTQKLKPDADNGGLTLAKDFAAITVVSESGKARHIAVDKNGTVYVKLRQLNKGNGIMVLKDENGDGKADNIKGYENYTGTGITIYKNFLYASSDSSVYRYPIEKGIAFLEEKNREVIIDNLPYKPQHEAKSITISDDGKLYVNIGAPSNACQEKDRIKDSPGMDPCPLLETYGGVWQFDAHKLNQHFTDGIRYSTGLRNCVALEWNSYHKQLYAVPHGRDQLNTLYPEYYTDEQNAELPSEEFFQLQMGGDYGWPYCYYDHLQNKKILAPEYGGDGKKTGRCDDKPKPLIAFPGHWAPNDLLFYHGNQFPEKYQHGAFIAFHGSWNRAPLLQGGYFVAFVPFKDGKPIGNWEVFAEGFSGGPEIKSPRDAKHRPMGLAEGPDGSLYISDSVIGTVWRILYTGK
ncbi:MAG TPA: PQQ-dependent sugar dehydrogenase [Cytophagaceae bacterium]|jgi:glucose/arabinose dehydrogenase|nr:PQQ-dependent sugar dehydrogenase [Cytophagaceae bacterium]